MNRVLQLLTSLHYVESFLNLVDIIKIADISTWPVYESFGCVIIYRRRIISVGFVYVAASESIYEMYVTSIHVRPDRT